MKKAMKWLAENNISYTLHDFKKHDLGQSTLDSWVEAVGWEILLNRRGTTWRKLADEIKNNIDEASAKSIMLDNLSIIKRPVLTTNNAIHVGFSEKNYQEIFLNV